MKSIYVTDEEFNNFTEEQLQRLIFVSNDGQGDTNCSDWNSISKIAVDEDGLGIDYSTNVSKIDFMWMDDTLSANNSSLLYFDFDNKYKTIYFRR